eukprot:6397234-Prymnesium_polylepis.1
MLSARAPTARAPTARAALAGQDGDVQGGHVVSDLPREPGGQRRAEGARAARAGERAAARGVWKRAHVGQSQLVALRQVPHAPV